jgi:NADH pyrophosphatase NudC (nudix superfamily)
MKTESVRHGFIYTTLWKMGYHLRRCSFCNRRRIFRRSDPKRPHPDFLTSEDLTESFNRKIAAAKQRDAAVAGTSGAQMDLNSTEKVRAEGTLTASSAVAVAEATDDDIEEHRRCPKCGSRRFHRSHRRWWERLINRSRMARCSKCHHRFMYPRHDDQ